MEHYYRLSLDENVGKLWKKNKICKSLKRKSPTKPIEVIFQRMLKRLRTIRGACKVYRKMKITKILDEIIKNDYFGITKNRKRFYHLVNRITTQSRYECVYSSMLWKDYDIKSMDWLQHENLDEKRSRMMLANVNRYLLNFIVKPLIKHFYHPLKSSKGYEVKFIENPKWQSFKANCLNLLLKLGHLLPKDGVVMPRGILRLFPKTDCDSLEFRSIIWPYKRNRGTKLKFKRLSKIINQLAIKTSGIGNKSLFTNYACFICEEDIYGVKLDVKDAFGNIDIPLICQAINESDFENSDKSFILSHLQNQFVLFDKKVYQWTHGLLQGDNLSSSLCDLYMSIMEKRYLHVFLCKDIFLHRSVDDYIMCSQNSADVQNFFKTVNDIFELNKSKTEYAGNNGNENLTYFGQVFNLKTREVTKLYSFEKDKSIRHKLKCWNTAYPLPKKEIILNTLKFCNNNNFFKKMELNTIFNTEGCVLINFFKGMIFLAFKFDVAVMAVRDFEQEADELPFLSEIIDELVYDYSNIAFRKMQTCLGCNYKASITYHMLKVISYRAFINVLVKNNEFYKTIIARIKRGKKRLYVDLSNIMMNFNVFTKIPHDFSNIRMSRKSKI